MGDGLMRRVEQAFQPQLFVNHYGSSEIYTFTIDQQASRKPGSSGRSALNQRVRVVPIDAESAQVQVKPMEEGQIVADLASDEAFEGYLNRPEATAKALREGWYFTGDTGYFDEDGDLFVTGRVDDLIITGGENISPVEIENVLSLHPPSRKWWWSVCRTSSGARSSPPSSSCVPRSAKANWMPTASPPAWPSSSGRGVTSSSTKFPNPRWQGAAPRLAGPAPGTGPKRLTAHYPEDIHHATASDPAISRNPVRRLPGRGQCGP